MSAVATRTEGRGELRGIFGGASLRRGARVGRWRRGPEQRVGALALLGASGACQAVAADLGKALWEHVPEEAVEELLGWEAKVAGLAGRPIAIAEGDLAIVEGLESAVGKGDTEDVAGEVAQDVGAGAGGLGMDDPRLLPKVSGRAPSSWA